MTSRSALHRWNRATAGCLGENLVIEICALVRFFETVLSLAELGEVEGGDFFGFFDLLLVPLDLSLKLVDERLHTLVVLAVLVSLEGELLDPSLALPQVLLSISKTSALGIHLRFELSDATLEFTHGLFSSLESVLFGIIKASLHVLGLGLHELPSLFQDLSVLLLSTEFISKASSINHGTLGFGFGVRGFNSHLVQITRESLHLSFQLPLCSRNGLVSAGELSKSFVGVRELLFNSAASAVSLLQKSAGFLKSILVGVSLAISSDQVVMGSFLGMLFLFKLCLSFPDGKVILLNGFLSLSIGRSGMFEGSVKIKNIRFKLLLHAKSFSLSLGFHFNSSLHSFDAFREVPSGGFKLFILFSHATLNLLPHLSELELSTKNLIFFLLKSTFGFTKSSLQLHFLGLKTLTDFVNLVDVASTFANLVQDILDLIREGAILTTDLIKLKHSLIIGRLHTEEFGRRDPSFLLADIKIHAQSINLGLPFANNPIKLLGFLIHRSVENLGLIKLHGHLIKFSLKLSFALFQLRRFRVQLINSSFTFRKSSLQLELRHFKFLSLGNSFLLISLPPHVSLTMSLVKLTRQIILGSSLFVEMFAHTVNFMFGIAEFSKKGLAFFGFLISHMLDFIQLG